MDTMGKSFQFHALGLVRPATPQRGYTVPQLLMPCQFEGYNYPQYRLHSGAKGKRSLNVNLPALLGVMGLPPVDDYRQWLAMARRTVAAVNALIKARYRAEGGKRGDQSYPEISIPCPWSVRGWVLADQGLPPGYNARRPDFGLGF